MVSTEKSTIDDYTDSLYRLKGRKYLTPKTSFFIKENQLIGVNKYPEFKYTYKSLLKK